MLKRVISLSIIIIIVIGGQAAIFRSRPAFSAPERGGMGSLGLVGSLPNSLNPLLENDPAVQHLSPLLFETLLQVDPHSARLRPGLAQRWEYTADGKQVRFYLPPDLKWSNGEPLVAADLVQSLQATRHPALAAFREIIAPDEETLLLTFSAIDCAALTALSQLPLLPAAEITATLPTGSGPFRVVEWVAGQPNLTLAQNPHYGRPQPLLDGLTVRFVAEEDLPIALSEGQFDALGPASAAYPGLRDISYPAARMVYVAINYAPKNDPPLPTELRQALVLGLERQAIAAAGQAEPLAGPLLPGHWAADADLRLPDYDPAQARQLLAQAGLHDQDGDGWLDRDGERFELSIRVNGKNHMHQNLAWLISSYYRDLGLLVRAETVSFESIVDDLFTHDFNLALFSWPILPDPDQRLYWHSTQNEEALGLNFVSYDNPLLDQRLEEAVAIPGCDPAERAKLYQDVQTILAEDRPVDFLLAPVRHVLVGSRLQGLEPGPFAPFTWNAAAWYLQPQ